MLLRLLKNCVVAYYMPRSYELGKYLLHNLCSSLSKLCNKYAHNRLVGSFVNSRNNSECIGVGGGEGLQTKYFSFQIWLIG